VANIAMLGTGLIGTFYTLSLKAKRGRDQIRLVYAEAPEKTKAFAVSSRVKVPISAALSCGAERIPSRGPYRAREASKCVDLSDGELTSTLFIYEIAMNL